jgi:hypothetical protein
MPKLKHDDIPTQWRGLNRRPASEAGGGRLASWLRRALGRKCASGVWTLSPDGKLLCESWLGDTTQHE